MPKAFLIQKIFTVLNERMQRIIAIFSKVKNP